MPSDEEAAPFLPQTGNYQDLLSYRKSEVIYDFTFRFCEKFLKRGDRTIDQMVEAACSGKQNIAEDCKASVTSAEMELNSSTSSVPVWRNCCSTTETSSACGTTPCGRRAPKKRSTSADTAGNKTRPSRPTAPSSPRQPEVLANIALCHIHQDTYLLDQQRRRLEQDFVKQGGIRERMPQARVEYSKQQGFQPCSQISNPSPLLVKFAQTCACN